MFYYWDLTAPLFEKESMDGCCRLTNGLLTVFFHDGHVKGVQTSKRVILNPYRSVCMHVVVCFSR